MGDITFSQWQTFCIVLLVLLEFYNLIVKTRQNHRTETALRDAPAKQVQERMDAYDKTLKEIMDRIDKLERKDTEHVAESRLILRGLLALTRHGVDGNNIQGLKDYQAELQSYLVDK